MVGLYLEDKTCAECGKPIIKNQDRRFLFITGFPKIQIPQFHVSCLSKSVGFNWDSDRKTLASDCCAYCSEPIVLQDNRVLAPTYSKEHLVVRYHLECFPKLLKNSVFAGRFNQALRQLEEPHNLPFSSPSLIGASKSGPQPKLILAVGR